MLGFFNVLGGLLIQIKDELRALKENLTLGSSGNGSSCEVRQALAEINAEIRELKENLSRDLVGSCLFSKVKKELCELKEEMYAVKQNLSGVSDRGKITVSPVF